MKKKWMALLTAVVLVSVTVAGYMSLSADYGDANDPLVSLSYITQVVLPQANATIQKTFDAKEAEFDKTMDDKVAESKKIIEELLAEYNSADAVDQELLDAVEEKLSGLMAGSPSGTATAQEWKVVRLKSGQTLKGQVGTQLLLRFGEVSVVAESEPGLINLTSSNELRTGAVLAKNNLYMVTIKNNGIKVTENATLLVYGTYTVQ